jgi:bifunctional ADP-heptose synthase (sugar kinase/adenylyltransferase)
MHLTPALVERVLARAPSLKIAVIGDLFLDRYLDIDGTLTEPSIETGLDAYQVVGVRSMPGAAGTVINNLVALGVGTVVPVSVIGVDGEGFELEQALRAMPAVNLDGLVRSPKRRTPTYAKPMLFEGGEHQGAHDPRSPQAQARELNRLDIHPRTPLPADAERAVLAAIAALEGCNAAAVLDQVALPECGVITSSVRKALPALRMPVLADSRYRIGEFRDVLLKPNERECLAAVPEASGAEDAARRLMARTGKLIFLTRGELGISVVRAGGVISPVPAFPVTGPTDPVGAGDSTTAGILCALAAGLSPEEAASFGCLVASITVQKLGTTGTASPDELRKALS